MRIHAWGSVALSLCLLTLTACDRQDTTTGGTTAPVAGADGGATQAPASADASTSSAGTDEDATTTEAAGGVQGEPVEITLHATGDILSHARVNNTAAAYAGGQGYDYSPMFAKVAPLLEQGDLTLCHMETPVSPTDTDLSVPNVMVFNTPHEIVDALVGAGVDGCDFASNHTMDRGIQGLADTEQAMRDGGLGYSGPTAHEDRAGVAETYDVDGVEVAHLAYTYTYPNSGTPTTDIPADAPWLADASWPTIHSEGILEQAHRAREEGADFVVVSMHWGDEYVSAPNRAQRIIAKELLESDDVDLILGTHVHVIQPCEKINGKHVLYGMGNFLSNQSPDISASLLPNTQEGMVAELTLRRDEQGVVTTSMRYQPTRVEITGGTVDGPHIITPVSPESYPQTWERTTTTVDSLGGCEAEPIHL